MKKLLVAGLMIFGMLSAGAQNKIGYVNSDELMSVMPESAKLQNELTQYQNELALRGQELYKDYVSLDSTYAADSLKLSPTMREIKRNDLFKAFQRAQGWQQEAQELYQAEAQKKIAPVQTKAREAIKAVAKENGYTYVFDTTSGALLVMPPGDDLLPLVKRKLGVKDAPAPPKK